jgi:pSer/pThr/pTyr-binding forkhead associated (FHA) protein
MYKLIIEDDEGKTTEVPIIRDEITVGRKEGNTIRLTERNVSRRHARITRQNSALYIEDLLSYNGIKVNGDRIQGKVAVGDGDRVQIGDYQLSIKLDKAAAKPGGAGQQAAQKPDLATAGAATVPVPAMQAQNASLPTVQHAAVTSAVKGPEKPARLIVISTNFARQEFPLDKAAVVIGRTDDNDVVLNHRSISRHHAKIVREGEHFHIVDMQSANGVRVNGEEYGKVELRKGDQIDLGHVRLIFVPPGQDIDIRDKIVDLDRKGPPIVAIATLVLLLVGAGGAAFWWLNRPPPVDAEGDAAKLLVDVDSDMQNKRWTDAVTKANRVISNPVVSAKTRDSATTRRARADQESKVQPTYERFLSSGENYDQALALYREIPADSVYHASARENYDKLFPLFVEKHLKAAEDARAIGKCEDFRNEVKIVLDLDPKQVKALQSKDRPCGEKTPSNDTTQVAAVKPEHERTPHKPKADKPVSEPVETPSKQPEVNAADADQTLSNAQTEYVNGNFSQAISVAKSVQRINPTRAWRIIGAAACNMKDVKLASEAFRHLDSASRQYLVYTCQRQGINNTNGSQFKLSDQ